MSRSWEWGPPGLETPKTVPGAKGPWIAAAFCLVVIFGVPWCRNTFGYVDLMSGNRSCPVLPSAVRSWSVVGDIREDGEAATLQKWIARHPREINKQFGAFCQTLLHMAAEWGREDLADLLIAGGADVEARNESDERPLHVAATYGRPTVVKLLLSKGADVGATGRRLNTPLHAAACGLGGQSNIEGRLEVAKLLIAAGANVNARERGSGFTPLRCAMHYESQNAAMARLLGLHGADPSGAVEPPIPGHARN
jgi:Ankyrin repeats (many copies)